ncbi:MAG TPA: hypothetical protein VL307_15010 [Chitinophagaceae bacterium]|nr:hypothetical protein [Chitinophagaceae bacterium]
MQQSGNYLLAPSSIRRSCTAGILLLLFAFSITPKQLLHDALARHKDAVASGKRNGQALFNAAGFVCKCDNLVAESPFTAATEHFVFFPLQAKRVKRQTALHTFYSKQLFFFELRGPPILLG